MIAFPEMIVSAATEAGIKIPEDLDNYDAEEFPHWHVYRTMQLGRSIPSWGCHWGNAKVIAKISKNEIKKLSIINIIQRGFVV